MERSHHGCGWSGRISTLDRARTAGGGAKGEPADFGVKDSVNRRAGEVLRFRSGSTRAGRRTRARTGRRTSPTWSLACRLDAMSPDALQAAAADLADSWLLKRIASGTIPFDPMSSDPDMVARGKIAASFAVLPAKLGANTSVVRVRMKETSQARLPAAWHETEQNLLEFGKAANACDGRLKLGGGFEAVLVAPEGEPAAAVLERLWRPETASDARRRDGPRTVTLRRRRSRPRPSAALEFNSVRRRSGAGASGALAAALVGRGPRS